MDQAPFDMARGENSDKRRAGYVRLNRRLGSSKIGGKMAEKSEIAWTDGTVNFWWGCFKVDQGCAHCYAETFSKRVGKDIWGPPAITEREIKKAVWNDLAKWDKKAKAEGKRVKMFVMSMGDFLENHPMLIEPRKRAVGLIESLTNTDILMLTKRPENALEFLSSWFSGWPKHVWFGTSLAEQKDEIRLAPLMKVPAPILWLSIEPMIGAIDLQHAGAINIDGEPGTTWRKIDWVICGGESGSGCRPMNIEWARALRKQCYSAAVPFFMKQLGGHPDKRKNPDEWPEDLRVREFPK